MKVLVIGYGSIGQRHVRILGELGCRVAVVSRRAVSFSPCFETVKDAMTGWSPDYVVVASRTHEHGKVVQDLVRYGFQGNVLIEKPLFDKIAELPHHGFAHAAVAYNLRFHPLIIRLGEMLRPPVSIITANIHVGSYMPGWRPDTDYRKSYSAKRAEGGGVLRDLSHELDYSNLLFGSWRRLTAMGGRLGALEIDSDDAYSILMETELCPLVTIHMNYLDLTPRREISININKETIFVDLIGNTLRINDNGETYDVDRDETYRRQHLAMINGEPHGPCTIKEAMETMVTIEAVEKAALTGTWIKR